MTSIATPAFGALVTYDFEDGFNPLVSGSNFSASSLQANFAGTGDNISGLLSTFPSDPPGTPTSYTTAVTPIQGNDSFGVSNGALAQFGSGNFLTDNFTFTVTPDVGYTLSLDALAVRITGDNTTNRTSYVTLRYSLGSTYDPGNFVTAGTADTSANSGSVSAVSNLSIAFGPSLESVSGPISFRLYVNDGTGGATNSIVRIDDIVLSGAVVPEPTVLPLLTGAVTLLAVRRRRI